MKPKIVVMKIEVRLWRVITLLSGEFERPDH